jgi:LPXTG-motif cell wall-anchored protein
LRPWFGLPVVFTTDASGAFSAEVIIPATLTGDHKLVATGLDEEHEAYRYLATAVTVTASGQGGGLPVTGTSVTAFVAAGLLLVVSGIALTRWSRRRRPA